MIDSSDWPFKITIPVIFRDLDAMGHVNNAVYFTYMETARTTFFRERLQLTDPGQFPVIVAEATCTYLAPLQLGDTLRVNLGVSRIGNRSFDFSYLISVDEQREIARAKTVMVTYDYQRQQAILIPQAILALLQSVLVPDYGD